MSASEPDTDKQRRRHRGPFIGMAAVVAFALIALVFLMARTADQGTPAPSGAGSIDGRTGEPTAGPGTAPATDATTGMPTEATPTPAPTAPVNPAPAP